MDVTVWLYEIWDKKRFESTKRKFDQLRARLLLENREQIGLGFWGVSRSVFADDLSSGKAKNLRKNILIQKTLVTQQIHLLETINVFNIAIVGFIDMFVIFT